MSCFFFFFLSTQVKSDSIYIVSFQCSHKMQVSINLADLQGSD